MQHDDVLQVLAEHRNQLMELGVGSLALFGSVAHDEAGPESDLDLLLEFRKPVGIFKIVALKEYLATLLGRSVDLVTRDSLKRQLRNRILEQAIPGAVTQGRHRGVSREPPPRRAGRRLPVRHQTVRPLHTV